MPETAAHRRTKAPGLVWIRRRQSFTPYWRASDKGFRPRTINLSRWADDPARLAKRCDELHAEMLEWRSARYVDALHYDGTVKSLISIYQRHPESGFHAVRPGTRHIYHFYLSRLEGEIGDRMVSTLSGLDLKRWHGEWSNGGKALSAAQMHRAVLDGALAFGVEARLPGCAETLTALRAAKRKLPRPKPREVTVTAGDVHRLRKAAHADGRPSMALAYALVFETTLRLWDVIGQWWPMDAPGVSDVLSTPNRNQRETKKWFGLRWEDIDENLVLRFVPSKTSAKTGLAVTYPLSMAPMVMDELAYWPSEHRKGPVVVNPVSGLPYSSNHFGEFWRKDRDAAGLPKQIWARDLRASGITEGRASGVSTDDAAKVAGHASTKTTSAVYDRAALQAAERFAEARALRRTEPN